MKVSSLHGVGGKINISSLKKAQVAQKVSASPLNSHAQIQISFAGNPDKNPKQIAAYATESNYLGGIYKAGGLGDVAEALPEALANHSKELTNDGKELDIRTFLPYYSFDNSDGKIYIAPKSTVEKMKAGKSVYYKDKVTQEPIDFKYGDVNYKLKDGEEFVLITESKDGSKVDKFFLLDDTGIQGSVERVERGSLNMEKIPYRIFKAQTPDRKDQTYLIYTPEMASGKTAYGIYQKYSQASDGTTAYGGSSAYGSTAYGGKSADGVNGITKAINDGHFKLSGTTSGDMFFTEQIRAMEEGIEKLAKKKTDKFNPQSILLHDRFAYVFISDAMQKAKDGDRHYQGMRFVPIFHNPGRDKQGVYANPFDYFRVVATKKDTEALHADKNYKQIEEISKKVIQGKATESESAKAYNFFKSYFPNMIDSEGTFNMTMIPIAATKEQPDNCKPGNVSKFYGMETRELPDIAQGITDKLDEIKDGTVDVVNGAKPANMAIDKQDGFFGSGTLNSIFKDINDPRHYTPFKATDTPEVILKAKKQNKKNLINIIADATKEVESGKDKDAIAKVFFNDTKMSGIRGADKDLPLALGGFSEFSEGDILITAWGRPDPQKGLVTTLAAFKETLQDESIPLRVRKHLKLIMGAGGGNDAFRGENSEWLTIQKLMKDISEIEVDGKKGVFKNNAVYINGLFPNRIANCADLAVFTSRWEPCGITPFESFATGTPVLSIKTGGAPDFITEGKNGFLTKSAFMVSADVLGLGPDATYEELDKARVEHSAKQVAEALRDKYLSPFMEKGTSKTQMTRFETKQKEYIANCLDQKIEWHNNNAYNDGRSALDLYAHEKCRTQDNEVNDTPVSSLRGIFDDTVMESSNEAKPDPISDPYRVIDEEEKKFDQGSNKSSSDSKVSIGKVIAPIIALGIAITMFVKSKFGKKKQTEQKENIPASKLNPAKINKEKTDKVKMSTVG